jgi:hypothetical protein
LLLGVNIQQLSVSDCLDVLHFLFEEDAFASQTGEHAEARSKTRSMLYSDLYGRAYKFALAESRSSDRAFVDESLLPEIEDDFPTPVDPVQRSATTKPYTPPTKVNASSRLPFGAALEAPLG